MNVTVPASAKWKKMKVPGATAQQLGDMGFAGVEVINDYTMTKAKRKRKGADKGANKQTQVGYSTLLPAHFAFTKLKNIFFPE